MRKMECSHLSIFFCTGWQIFAKSFRFLEEDRQMRNLCLFDQTLCDLFNLKPKRLFFNERNVAYRI